MTQIEVLKGDITKLEVDAIVNAANTSLLGGGGVDGAIHRAAGSKLLEECRTLNGCETGQSKITKGYNLPSKYVIQTVGPIIDNEVTEKKQKELANCYLNSLKLAIDNGIKTIAFPCISTGVFRFPRELAVQCAFEAVNEFLENDEDNTINRVVFCVYSNEDLKIYDNYIKRLNKVNY